VNGLTPDFSHGLLNFLHIRQWQRMHGLEFKPLIKPIWPDISASIQMRLDVGRDGLSETPNWIMLASEPGEYGLKP
jgi:hypothetical protein